MHGLRAAAPMPPSETRPRTPFGSNPRAVRLFAMTLSVCWTASIEPSLACLHCSVQVWGRMRKLVARAGSLGCLLGASTADCGGCRASLRVERHRGADRRVGADDGTHGEPPAVSNDVRLDRPCPAVLERRLRQGYPRRRQPDLVEPVWICRPRDDQVWVDCRLQARARHWNSVLE
jgi:hypothetical protein